MRQHLAISAATVKEAYVSPPSGRDKAVGLLVGDNMKLQKHHLKRAVCVAILVDFRNVIERFEERKDN